MNLTPVQMIKNALLNFQYYCRKKNKYYCEKNFPSEYQMSMSNEIRDEFNINASDNEDAPESPILFPVVY